MTHLELLEYALRGAKHTREVLKRETGPATLAAYDEVVEHIAAIERRRDKWLKRRMPPVRVYQRREVIKGAIHD